MAKIDTDTPYEISAEQLFEKTKNRKIIPLTLSADVGLGGRNSAWSNCFIWW